jgi:molybdopterin-containing oxidoreductase family iron-sulfur binding subunit
LLSLTGLTGTFYDYIKANAGTLITGSTWNQVLHDGIYVGVASAASASSDYSAAANALAKAKAASGLSIPRQVWVTVSKQITLGYKSFGLQEFLGIIMLQYLMQMLKIRTSNEIVANGGLNGSYATITTADGFKLENVPVIVQPGQAVGTIGFGFRYGRKA